VLLPKFNTHSDITDYNKQLPVSYMLVRYQLQ